MNPEREPIGTAGRAVLALLFILGVIGAVWRIDDHFVTRREFQQMQADVTAIREHLGIPRQAPAPDVGK